MNCILSFITGLFLGLCVAIAVFFAQTELQHVEAPLPVHEEELPPLIQSAPEEDIVDVGPPLQLMALPVLTEDLSESVSNVVHLPEKYLDRLSVSIIHGDVNTLSDEFIEIFELTDAQVVLFNDTFKRVFSEIEQIESDTAVVLESTDMKVVLQVPPFPEAGERLEAQITALADELSPMAKQYYLNSIGNNLFRSTSAYGLGVKTITITDIDEEYMTIKEEIKRERSGSLGLSNSSSTSRLSQLPEKYDHLLIERD
jgi:hypothetical protein